MVTTGNKTVSIILIGGGGKGGSDRVNGGGGGVFYNTTEPVTDAGYSKDIVIGDGGGTGGTPNKCRWTFYLWTS